jgi:hypothetical protein
LFIVSIMINSRFKRRFTIIIISHRQTLFYFIPFTGDNSTTLNFSILDNSKSNVTDVYSALVITEKYG